MDAEARDVQTVDGDAPTVQLHETENAVDQAALAGACGRTCNAMITTLKVSRWTCVCRVRLANSPVAPSSDMKPRRVETRRGPAATLEAVSPTTTSELRPVLK